MDGGLRQRDVLRVGDGEVVMALAVPADFDAWAKKSLSTDVQTELNNCVSYAQAWIANQAGLRSLEKESAAVTTYFDGGKDTYGEDFWAPMDLRPMWHTGSDLVTVVESGTTVGVAVGYSTTAGAMLSGVNSFQRVRLSRVGGWAVNKNNIALTCKCGFDGSSTATTNALPPDVKRLVMEVAWLMFNSAGRVGISNTSKVGASADIVNDLSPMSQATLDWLRGI